MVWLKNVTSALDWPPAATPGAPTAAHERARRSAWQNPVRARRLTEQEGQQKQETRSKWGAVPRGACSKARRRCRPSSCPRPPPPVAPLAHDRPAVPPPGRDRAATRSAVRPRRRLTHSPVDPAARTAPPTRKATPPGPIGPGAPDTGHATGPPRSLVYGPGRAPPAIQAHFVAK